MIIDGLPDHAGFTDNESSRRAGQRNDGRRLVRLAHRGCIMTPTLQVIEILVAAGERPRRRNDHLLFHEMIEPVRICAWEGEETNGCWSSRLPLFWLFTWAVVAFCTAYKPRKLLPGKSKEPPSGCLLGEHNALSGSRKCGSIAVTRFQRSGFHLRHPPERC